MARDERHPLPSRKPPCGEPNRCGHHCRLREGHEPPHICEHNHVWAGTYVWVGDDD